MQCLQKSKQGPFISLLESVGVLNLKSPAVWKMWLAWRQLPYGYFYVYLLLQYAVAALSAVHGASFPWMSGQGLRPPEVSHSRVATVHSWSCSDHGCVCNVHRYDCGPFSLGLALCQAPMLPALSTAVAGWTPSSSPGCATAGWLPTNSTPLPVPDTPSCRMLKGTQALSDPPLSPAGTGNPTQQL